MNQLTEIVQEQLKKRRADMHAYIGFIASAKADIETKTRDLSRYKEMYAKIDGLDIGRNTKHEMLVELEKKFLFNTTHHGGHTLEADLEILKSKVLPRYEEQLQLIVKEIKELLTLFTEKDMVES